MSFRDHDALERLSYRAQKLSARSIASQPSVSRLHVNGLDTYPPFFPASARNGTGSNLSTANHSPTIITSSHKASANNNTTTTTGSGSTTAMSPHVNTNNTSGGSNPHYFSHNNNNNGNLTTTATDTKTTGHAPMMELSTPTSPHGAVTLISWLHSPTRRAAFSLVSHPSSPSGATGHNGSATQTTSLLPPHPPPQPQPPSSSSLPQHLTSQSLPQSSAAQQQQQQVQQQPMHGYGPAASVSSSTVATTTTMTTSSMGWFSGRPATNAIGPTTRSSDLHSPRTGMALQAMSLHSTEGNTAGMTPTTTTITSGTAVAHNAGSEAGCRIDFNASDDNVYRFGTSPSLAPSGPGLLLAATSITTHATSITQSEVNEESVQQQQQPSSPVLPLLRCGPQGTMALAETYSAASARPVASRTNNNITSSNNMHARARGGMALASCSTTSGVGGNGSAHNYTYNVRVLRSGGTGSAAIPAAPPLTAAVLFGANNNNNNNNAINGETTTTPKTNTSSNNNTNMMRGGVPFAWQPVPQPQAFFPSSSALSPSFQPSQQQPQPPLSMPISTTTSVTTVTASSPSAVVRMDALRQPAYLPSVNNSSAGLVMEELISPRPTRLLAPITIPYCDPSKAANVLTTPGSPVGPQEEEKSGNDNGITSLDSNAVDTACPDTTTTTTVQQQQQEREEEEEVAHEGGTLLVPQSSLHESLIRLMTLDSAGTVEDTTTTAERKAEEENEARLYADAPTPAHTRALIAQSSQDRHRRVVNANTAANSTTTTTTTSTTAAVVRTQSSADTAADTSSHHHQYHYHSPAVAAAATAATRTPGQSPVCSPLPEFPTFNESLTSASAFTPTSMHASRIYDGIFSASVSAVCGHCAAGHAEDGDCNGGGCCCAHRCLHMPHLCASLHAGAKFELPVMLSLTGRDQLRENDPSEYEALFGTSRTSTMCTTFTRPRHGRRGTALARVIYSMAAKANAAAAATATTTTTSGGGATRVKSGGGYRRNSHGLHRYVHCVHTTSSNNATRREGSRQLTRTSLAMNNATSFATAASSMTNLNSTLSMGNFYCYYNATPCEAGPEQQRPSHTAITTTPAPTQLSSKSQSLFLVGPEQHSVQDKENDCQNGTSGANSKDNNNATPGSPHSSHPQAQQSGLRRGSHPNTLQQQQHQIESNNNDSSVVGNGKAYTCDSHAQTHTCGTQTNRAAPQPFSCARIWTTFRPRSADLASRRNSLAKANGHHHNNNSRDTNNNNNGSTSTLSSQLDAGLVLPEPPFTRSGSAVDCDTGSRCSTANHHNNNNHHHYHRCGRRQSKKAFNKSNGTNDEAHSHFHSSSGDGSPIELADTTSFAMATRMLHSEHSTTNGDDDSDAAPRVGGSAVEGPRSRSCYRCTAHSRASRHSHHAEQHVVVLPTQKCLCRHRRSHQHQQHHKPSPGVGNKEESLLATTITTAGQGKRIRHTTSGSGKNNNSSNSTSSSSTTMSSSEEEEDGNPLGHQVQRHSGGCTLHSHNRSFPRTDSTSAHCLSITSLTSTQSSHLETLEAMYADSMPHAAHTIAPAASLLRHTLSEKSVS